MTSLDILGDRVPGCDGNHPAGGCLRCWLLPRIEQALYELRRQVCELEHDRWKLSHERDLGIEFVCSNDCGQCGS